MVPPTVTLCSCIASSRADCVFGVARLISSASTIWANIGPGWKLKARLPSLASVMMLVPMMSDGIRSGVNWMRLNFEVQHLAQRAHQQRLAQAGHAFEQGVAADEQARQDAVDDVGMADDDLADLAMHPAVGLAELVGAFLHLRCGVSHGVSSPRLRTDGGDNNPASCSRDAESSERMRAAPCAPLRGLRVAATQVESLS